MSHVFVDVISVHNGKYEITISAIKSIVCLSDLKLVFLQWHSV